MEAIGIIGMLEVAGTAITTMGAIQAGAAQQQQELNNAAILDQNAKQASFEASVAAQETDFEARQELGALLASGGASGINLGSGSSFLQRKTKEELAAKDRARIVHSGEIEKLQLQQQANDARSAAKAAKRSTLFSAISGGLNMGTSYVEGAARVKKRTAQTITGRSGT